MRLALFLKRKAPVKSKITEVMMEEYRVSFIHRQRE